MKYIATTEKGVGTFKIQYNRNNEGNCYGW